MVDRELRKCSVCGLEFQPTTTNRKYCSRACAKKARKIADKEAYLNNRELRIEQAKVNYYNRTKTGNCYACETPTHNGTKFCKACHQRKYRARMARGKCNSCKEDAPPDRTMCRPCSRKNLLSRHGITPAIFQQMLDEQGGSCLFCPVLHSDDVPLNIDHDHRCCPGSFSCGRCIRGLLCDKCNGMLGLACDSPDRLRIGADYLEKWLNRG